MKLELYVGQITTNSTVPHNQFYCPSQIISLGLSSLIFVGPGLSSYMLVLISQILQLSH